MAKKKTAETANIKAAPVLRVENPGSGDNQSTPVITKSYCVRDDWKDKNKVNYVAFKSVDGEVQNLTVNGEPAGGGGGDVVVLHPHVEVVEQTARLYLDKTWAELKNLFDAQKDVLIITKNDQEPYPNIIGMQYMFNYNDSRVYTVTFKDANGDSMKFTCSGTTERPFIEV